MARLSRDEGDRALWLTLAQSWVRLAEHVARAEMRREEERRERSGSESGDGTPTTPARQAQALIQSP